MLTVAYVFTFALYLHCVYVCTISECNRRHGNNFFKDRHYLDTAFNELKVRGGERKMKFLEVGCGVGNAFLPLLLSNEVPVMEF